MQTKRLWACFHENQALGRRTRVVVPTHAIIQLSIKKMREKNQEFSLIATAAAGLEALVGKELRDMGIECQVENGRARFKGTMEDIAKANLWLRTADRVKIVVGEFDALTFDDLF